MVEATCATFFASKIKRKSYLLIFFLEPKNIKKTPPFLPFHIPKNTFIVVKYVLNTVSSSSPFFFYSQWSLWLTHNCTHDKPNHPSIPQWIKDGREPMTNIFLLWVITVLVGAIADNPVEPKPSGSPTRHLWCKHA